MILDGPIALDDVSVSDTKQPLDSVDALVPQLARPPSLAQPPRYDQLGFSTPELVESASAPATVRAGTSASARKWWLPSFKHRRWSRALVLLLLLYLVISLAVGIPFLVMRMRRHSRPEPPPSWQEAHMDATNMRLSMPPVELCSPWKISNHSSDGIIYASVNYTFPFSGCITATCNTSQGSVPDVSPNMFGSLIIDLNPDTTATDILISTNLSSADRTVHEQIRVCSEMSMDGNGIQIYVPDDLNISAPAQLDIQMLFPQTGQSPKNMDGLVTSLPLVSQTVKDLGSAVRFEDVFLEGALSDIHVEYIEAPSVSVTTSMAQISGTYNVSQCLRLDTVAGNITADITLVNTESMYHTTELNILTGQGSIDANVSLLAPSGSPPHTPPNFRTTFTTFSAPLTVALAHAPGSQPSYLQVSAQNSLAEANVTLDSLYRGTFEVQTRFAPAEVDFAPTVPEVQGVLQSETMLQYDLQSPSHVLGWTGWGQRAKYWGELGQGHVQVFSSLSPVSLAFGHDGGG